jgi:hypothetical protein
LSGATTVSIPETDLMQAAIPTASTEATASPAQVSSARGSPAPARDVNHVPLPSALTGTLIGFRDNGGMPLVLFPGQRGSGAIAADAIVDLHGAHIGRQVLLVLEDGDVQRPVILGLLRNRQSCPITEPTAQVELDADGERLIVTAREQLVLRCGNASITLTKAGKVLIQGTYVCSKSSGVLSIKGGSIQMN